MQIKNLCIRIKKQFIIMKRIYNLLKKYRLFCLAIFLVAFIFHIIINLFQIKSTSIYDTYEGVLKDFLEAGYSGFGAQLVDIDNDDVCELAIILDDSHNSLVYLYSISTDEKRVLTLCDDGLGSDGYLEYSTSENIIISSYYGALRNGGNYEIINLYRIDSPKLLLINSLRKEQNENGEITKLTSNGNDISEEKYNEIYQKYVLSGKINVISYSSATKMNSIKDVEKFLLKANFRDNFGFAI